MAGAAVLAAAALLPACGGSEPEAPAPVEPAENERTGRPLRPVLASKLAEFGVEARTGEELARELRSNEGLLAADRDPATPEAVGATDAAQPDEASAPPPVEEPALDPELVEMCDGLAAMVARDPRQLRLARADVENLAEDMVPVLVAALSDEARSADELRVLADLAAAAPDARLARTIGRLAAEHEEPWLRRHAAWSLLPHASAEGADGVVPLLVWRLKYERDPEAPVWIAAALAAFKSYAGLSPLFDRTGRAAGDPVGDAARGQLASIVAASGAADASALWSDWTSGSAGRDDGASPALRGELWRFVADLSGEHFQLRGVDDARYVLSRLGPWAGRELAEALEDEDPYVRLHVAQCLERMGRRGLHATASLAAALDDRDDAVAGAAAEALVAVAGPDALQPLLDRLDRKPPHEVRVALVRALGRVPEVAPLDRLQEVFEGASAIVDLRLAAAEGLVRGGRAEAVLPWLPEALVDRFGDPAGAEALAEVWLRDAGNAPPLQALRQGWTALAPPAAVIHTAEQVKERRAARAELLRTFVAS
ncbi:MAG: HEAT repeat domain-containing protein [Planctomycetota bacterium]